MLGGSIPGSGVLLSLSHARAVGCSSTASPRTSSSPLAMEEIFSFWAVARFSKKRALQDRGGCWPGARQGWGRWANHAMPHCTASPVALKPPAMATPRQGPRGFNLLRALQRDERCHQGSGTTASWEPKARATTVPPSPVGPSGPSADCNPHP